MEPAYTATERMAERFADLLAEEIGPDKFERIKALNRTPEYASPICASHDFCDANMVMAQAFEEVAGHAPEANSESDADIWNAAWDHARQKGLI